MKKNQNTQRLLKFTAIYKVSDNILSEISTLVIKNDCNFDFIKLKNVDSTSLLISSVTGKWNGISKVEAGFKKIIASNSELALSYLICEDLHAVNNDNMALYQININSFSNDNIILHLQKFCDIHNLKLLSVSAKDYSKLHINSPLFVINANILLSVKSSLGDIREQFIIFCDNLNVDGLLDIIRPC